MFNTDWLSIRNLLLLFCCAGFAVGQEVTPLALDQAVALALEHNRSLQAASAEMERAHEQTLATRTQRLPQSSLQVTAGQLLTQPGLTFPAGSLGRLADGSLLPATETTVRSARRPSAFVYGQVNQPLTQQYRIGKQLAVSRTDEAIAASQRQQSEAEVVNQVRRLYSSLVAAQSQVATASEAVLLYEELQRITGERVLQKVALAGDGLEVRARLAQARLDEQTARDAVTDDAEQFNILLGRGVSEPVRLRGLAENEVQAVELPEAQHRALADRPELAVAALQVQRADQSRRAKLAEYVPDVSLNFTYLSFLSSSSTLPSNIASAGFQLQWEPFDWGRKAHEANALRQVEQQARLRESDTQARVLAEVNSAHRRLEQARKALDVARMQQEAAREGVREVTVQFEQKASLLRDVLQQQSAKTEADGQWQRALAQYWTAHAELARAMGERR